MQLQSRDFIYPSTTLDLSDEILIAAGERKLHFAKYGYLKTAGFNETSKISIYLIESNIEHSPKITLSKIYTGM